MVERRPGHAGDLGDRALRNPELEERAPFSVMFVGLHPESEDVALVFDVGFWWRTLTGGVYEEWPVEVRESVLSG